MIKTTPSDFRPQTSDFIFVKDSLKDSSLDFEHLRCDPHKNHFPEARYSSAFSVEIFLKIIISGQRPYFIKDFLQRFLAKQPQKHPSNIRLNSDDKKRFLAKQPPKNPRNTRRTRILVKDYSQDFC